MIKKVCCAVVALLLVGCTDIRTSGPVEEVPIGSEPRGVQIVAAPPQSGVAPVRLVEGFVQAMAEPESDWAVARQYLTTSAADQWRPRDGGIIYKGVVSDQEGAVVVQGTRAGVLDADGRFTAAGDNLSHDFGVIEEAGEWRIGLPPEGLLVSDYIFERYWSHMTVYFMARAGDHLVPDLVHIPEDMLTPSRVVEAQIAGPSGPIEDAVRNAVGSGVRLTAEGAGVDVDGTASLALTGLSQDMTDDRRRVLGAQLLWSLTAIPRVTGLSITVDGVPFQLPGQNSDGVLELSSQPLQNFQRLSRAATSDLFGVSDGVGGRIGSTKTFLPMSSGDEPVSEVAVSVDGTLVGFINEARTTALVGPLGGTLVRTSLPGLTDLRSAQFSLGHLWAIGSDSQGVTRLLRFDGQGTIDAIDSSALNGTIVDFAMTQEGARIAAIVESSGTNKLMLSSLVNDRVPRLESTTTLPLLAPNNVPLTAFRALDWSGETALVMIAEASDGTSVFRAAMDGSIVEDLGPVSEKAVQITALPGPNGEAVVVRSEDDTVWRHDASTRWTRLEISLQEISYPG